MLRSGLRGWLQAGGMSVVGEAIDGRGAIEQVERHEPDIVLMDITMPGMDGLTALEEVHERFPDVRVVMLSVHADEERVLEAMRAGASGYMLKSITVEELLAAIRVVASGGMYLAQPVSRHVMAALGAPDGEATRAPQLSPRQVEVLVLIAKGRTTPAIAAELGISVKTVETHRRNLMEKLNLHSVAELTKYAIREGVTTVGA